MNKERTVTHPIHAMNQSNDLDIRVTQIWYGPFPPHSHVNRQQSQSLYRHLFFLTKP